MTHKFVALFGLTIFISAGCQSYYPYGYGPGGMYSQFPQGTYVPSTTKTSPTPVDGQKKLQNNQTDSVDGKGTHSVPNYKSPAGAPSDLGAQPDSDDEDAIKKKSSSRLNGVRTPASSDRDDDDEPTVSSTNGDRFVRPVEYRDGDQTADSVEPRRLPLGRKPSPYKKDPRGYSWLAGVVSKDSISKLWLLTYNRDNSDEDEYGGVLTLADDEALDTLVDGDVIRVEGTLDRANSDRFDKPTYRVKKLSGPYKAQSR